ncbi:dihydrofolate reductase [Neorhizobium sp. P12A]|uniref:dihydrofolate reductase n=1 Tax=Rhizobium/Agrobacterium group TaxID=227290 RepID=UPI001049E8D7|nr:MULTISPECIES: dihydrofolate reductase [Rhizobium/Agrobacterium group]KAA0701184.1 dihydrofolate reductase [Neorhizobium sp. P12A]TCR83542.1 dihydrofolate reductase [Rhizobium sp. BK376]
MSHVTKTIVVAVSRNGIIGREGGLPWRLSTDLKRFKASTLGKPVVAGRKTFESFGKPLPGRPNIVITRDRDYSPADVHVVHSLVEAYRLAEQVAGEMGAEEICIIGGGDIYRQAMDDADKLLITHVETEVDGDTSFPPVDPAIWQSIEEIAVPAGEKDNYPTRFVTYVRRQA